MTAPALVKASLGLGLLTTSEATITVTLGTVSQTELDRAMNAGGRTIEFVTKLTQAPTAGRAFSTAAGEGAQAVAAGARGIGNLYSAQIPEQAVRMLEQAGLVFVRTTMMPNGAVGKEYRFTAEAMEYLARFFKEVHQ
jgi:hypothetical protein